MSDIKPEQWNRLAADAGPFMRHEFLMAMEASGSATAATGWEPRHLVVHSQDVSPSGEPQLLAAMPLYLKDNSYGEFVFDWSWAEAYYRHGRAYYPKLLTAVPFTPCVAPRILLSPDAAAIPGEQSLTSAIIDHTSAYAEQQGVSSWHVLFPQQSQSELLAEARMMPRSACRFHWTNRGYDSFEDFLAGFSSRKRKNLRKEREAVFSQGISFEHFSGSQISEALWDEFYLFYRNTYDVRGQQAYLRRKFFSLISASMPENILLIMARKNERYIAGALCFHDGSHLYGRYWGCAQDYQFLHFETCYYQGIDYCIANKMQSFDPGAQGEHKIQRGFEPIKTWSNHLIIDRDFSNAIEDFLVRENQHIEAYMDEARKLLPFRRSQTSS